MLHPIESTKDAPAVTVPGPAGPGQDGRGSQDGRHSPSRTCATEDSPWHANAACRRDEAVLFFAPSKEPTAARLAREEQAKRVCARCPVLLECREHALAQPEPYGVWGGLTAAERRVVLARRRRRQAELRADVQRVGRPRIAAAG